MQFFKSSTSQRHLWTRQYNFAEVEFEPLSRRVLAKLSLFFGMTELHEGHARRRQPVQPVLRDGDIPLWS